MKKLLFKLIPEYIRDLTRGGDPVIDPATIEKNVPGTQNMPYSSIPPVPSVAEAFAAAEKARGETVSTAAVKTAESGVGKVKKVLGEGFQAAENAGRQAVKGKGGKKLAFAAGITVAAALIGGWIDTRASRADGSEKAR